MTLPQVEISGDDAPGTAKHSRRQAPNPTGASFRAKDHPAPPVLHLRATWVFTGAQGPSILGTSTLGPSGSNQELVLPRYFMARRLAATPLGRVATADEVADAAAFLASPANTVITGETLLIDGGASACIAG